MNRSVILTTACLALGGCPKAAEHKPAEPPPRRDAGAVHVADDAALIRPPVSLPPARPLPVVPAGLPPLPTRPGITPAAVALGELLFYDARLSFTGRLACATCHDPAHGYAGVAQQPTASETPNLRRTPTLVNLAWVPEYGWDGRYPTLDGFLDAHTRGQLGELRAALPTLVAQPVYRAHFERVHGSLIDDPAASTARRDELAALEPASAAVARAALAAFVLTRYEGGSAWDLVEAAARVPRPGTKPDPVIAGYLVFAGRGQCAVCHPPPLYTDHKFHRVAPNVFQDPGRGRVDPNQPDAFRTPTLRGAASRSAFFHTGTPTTLAGVADSYLAISQSRATSSDRYDRILYKMAFTAEDREPLLAFLAALAAPVPAPPPPTLP